MNAEDRADAFSPILVCGAAHIDRRARSDQPYRAQASNPGRLEEAVGGTAYNAVLALAALGRPVSFFGARGGDPTGLVVEEALARLGVRDLAITWLDRATPTYTAILDHEGELVAGIADMALYALLKPRLVARRQLRQALDACDALLVDANLPSETLERLALAATPRPIGAIGVSPAKVRALLPLLPRLSALFVSLAEAASLVEASAGTRPSLVVELLAELGVRRAVVTDGPRDALILDRGAIHLQRPPAVAAQDVTGAGDTLAGVAFHHYCEGLVWVEAVRCGIAAASLRVGADGLPRSNAQAAISRALAAMAAPQTLPGEFE